MKFPGYLGHIFFFTQILNVLLKHSIMNCNDGRLFQTFVVYPDFERPAKTINLFSQLRLDIALDHIFYYYY